MPTSPQPWPTASSSRRSPRPPAAGGTVGGTIRPGRSWPTVPLRRPEAGSGLRRFGDLRGDLERPLDAAGPPRIGLLAQPQVDEGVRGDDPVDGTEPGDGLQQVDVVLADHLDQEVEGAGGDDDVVHLRAGG